MAQDIRELLKQDKGLPSESLVEGHEARFLEKLDKELPQEKKKNSYTWLKIAASIVVILSVSMTAFFQSGVLNVNDGVVTIADPIETLPDVVRIEKQSALANISPEYKKVEEYYTSSIKLELSKLSINDDNKELIDSFMKQLEQLDIEYQSLNAELLEVGANEQTVQALIDNLQLRLNLMMKLKSKLNKLKNIADETYQDQQA